MSEFICTTCGTQYEASESPPAQCAICEEYRQFVLPAGTSWTTLAKLRVTHKATFHDEQGILGIGTSPDIGIGQRALLVRTPTGNILWDCIALIDDAMVEIINALGGLTAIAISHPHYYTTMTEWSRAFGNIPVWLHKADAQWIMRGGDCVKLWEGDAKELAPGVTLIRTGGHYEGGTVLHWAQAAGGKGAILSAPTFCRSRRTAGFSASCAAIRIICRSEKRRCVRSRQRSNRTSTTPSTGPSGIA